jgi:hypothetical protein
MVWRPAAFASSSSPTLNEGLPQRSAFVDKLQDVVGLSSSRKSTAIIS